MVKTFIILAPGILAFYSCSKTMERKRDLPPVTLHLSGTLLGRLDPCGCASNQKGGLAVRKTFLWQRRAAEAVRIEGCRFLPEERWGKPFAELIGSIVLKCLGDSKGCLSYKAVGVGLHDTFIGEERLLKIASKACAPPLVACDLVGRNGEPAFHPFTVVKQGGKKVFVTAVSFSTQGHGKVPWYPALRSALSKAPPDSYRILLLDGDTRDAMEIARSFPHALDLMLTSTGEYNPTPSTEIKKVGDTYILDPGSGGRFIVEIILRRAKGSNILDSYILYPLVPLEKGIKKRPGAIPPDPLVKEIIVQGRCNLADGKALEAAALMGIPRGKASYTGTRACFPCHEKEAGAWLESPHARAWKALLEAEEERGWPITSSPDCVSCHVIGLGYRSGFVSPENTPHLTAVGCENCHGPGSRHIERMAADPKARDKAISRANDGGFHCFKCHDTERQTHGYFHFDEKWEKIKH